MTLRVTTETKSVYMIYDDNTWTRVVESEASGALRTNGGSIKSMNEPTEGESLCLFTDEINDGYPRMILTSKVKKVEVIEQ